jgi:hypothetical protein
MKVLYIGGTGEISHACVAESVKAGHDVAVFNRDRSGRTLPAGVRLIQGDLDDETAYGALGNERFDTGDGASLWTLTHSTDSARLRAPSRQPEGPGRSLPHHRGRCAHLGRDPHDDGP